MDLLERARRAFNEARVRDGHENAALLEEGVSEESRCAESAESAESPPPEWSAERAAVTVANANALIDEALADGRADTPARRHVLENERDIVRRIAGACDPLLWAWEECLRRLLTRWQAREPPTDDNQSKRRESCDDWFAPGEDFGSTRTPFDLDAPQPPTPSAPQPTASSKPKRRRGLAPVPDWFAD